MAQAQRRLYNESVDDLRELVSGGAPAGRDPETGLSWSFETPEAHWASHDGREVAYWLSRTPAERLGQADAYRVRVHGACTAPPRWPWKFVDVCS